MQCPICGSSAEELPKTGDFTSVHCPTCGSYNIAGSVDIESLRDLDPAQRQSVLEKAKRSAQQGERPVITSYLFEKHTFTGSTKQDANRKADEWWARQKGLRLIHRNQIGVGFAGPATSDMDQWTVNIYYEAE